MILRFTGGVVHDFCVLKGELFLFCGLQEECFFLYLHMRSGSCLCCLQEEWFMFLRFTGGGAVLDVMVHRIRAPVLQEWLLF